MMRSALVLRFLRLGNVMTADAVRTTSPLRSVIEPLTSRARPPVLCTCAWTIGDPVSGKSGATGDGDRDAAMDHGASCEAIDDV
jgi:hypothetical protein